MSITDFKVWTVCLNTNWSTTIRIMKTIFLYSKSVPWIQDLERCVNTHRSRSRIQGTLLKYRKIVFIILIVVNQLVFKQTVHTLKSVFALVSVHLQMCFSNLFVVSVRMYRRLDVRVWPWGSVSVDGAVDPFFHFGLCYYYLLLWMSYDCTQELKVNKNKWTKHIKHMHRFVTAFSLHHWNVPLSRLLWKSRHSIHLILTS